MSIKLPDSLLVLERGWLSANNILFFDGHDATLIDSGYVTHAEQTVDLVYHALDGRRLNRVINTHSHSDHIGGNAALKTAFDCEIIVPAGLHAAIADWDKDALLLSPLGQQSARFQHDRLVGADDQLEMGASTGKRWRFPVTTWKHWPTTTPKAHSDLRRRALGKRLRGHFPRIAG
jgi:glyoxylase-like metal-dependent hydrolase (beta-lactamase superfamily II)